MKNRFVCAAVLLLSVFTMIARPVRAQGTPENSSRELAIFSSGGHGLNGSTSGTAVWNVGLRYGMILTAPHGPGALSGQLEYAVDVLPAWVLWQKTNTAYGASVDPFAFKWIFAKPKKVKPYLIIEGGALFTNTKVPEMTSQVNFTTAAGAGLHFLGPKYNWSAEVRFQHISNAGLATPNPGINTIQVRIGFGSFRR